MTDVSPQDFDFDAWLDGAERPERSVTVYQKAGLIADLDRLAEQIEHADEDDDVDGPSMAGGVGRLRAEYARVAQQFHDSGLSIRIQALDEPEKLDMRKTNPDLSPTQLGYLVISSAITSPKMTPAQLEKLEKRIGETQFNRVIAKFHEVCNEMPSVSADFLPKPSTQGDGGE